MAIDGDTAIVGVLGGRGNERFSGAAYVYGRHEGGVNNRGEVAKITASNGAVFDEFAQSVAISGDTAIVGVCWNCDGGYVYFETQVCLDDAECGDGDACNGAETCDTETGECFPGTPIECDDGDECNGVELCDPQTGDCLDGAFGDCNGIDDACELASCGSDPGCDDCDGNGSLDRCDIASGQPDVNGNGVLDQCEPCTDNASCDDSSPCSFDRCIDNVCWNDLNARYGDVAGAEGVCGPDGQVSLVDILAVLDGFGNVFVGGCDSTNVDITSNSDACVGDGTIDLLDVLAILDAFQGTTTCCPATR